ncbi:MAG: HD domain-containing protein [candidate division WOR-3 bacterium]|nr:HD domain-containing protein [candidate division WOR-3 bacterium]
MNKELILNDLINISIQISSVKSLNNLLDTIVRKARDITNADAGSLYLKEGNKLRFIIAQNDTLNNTRIFNTLMHSDKSSIAGYTSETGRIVNIEDVYEIGDQYPFDYNRDFDEKNKYRCKSMLAVPMKDSSDNVIGVIQLINAMDRNGNIISFPTELENPVNSFASMAAVSVKNMQLKDNIKQAYLDTIYRLSVAAEFKDTDTGLHIRRMSRYSELICRYLGCSDDFCELILYASPLHDVGKIGIPDSILTKPAKLDDDEWKTMKTHTAIGYQILADSDYELIKTAAAIALHHHERFDGRGYPNGISGEDIPLEARIVSLADVFDALSSKRPYKEPWPLDKILSVIHEEKDKQFDSRIIDAFDNAMVDILTVRDKMQE